MTETIRMRGADGEGLLLLKYEEVVFPYLDTVDPMRGLKRVRDMQYKEGDIVLCTYPKSGTHWMFNVLWKLKSLSDADDRPQDAVLELEPPVEDIENQKYPRIIYTHQKPSRLYPSNIANGKGKIVLFLRNPKDVMVSLYYHLKNAKVLKNKQSWAEFIQSCLDGDVPMGSHFTYLQEWDATLKEIADGKSCLPIEVFYYEEFKMNPKENLQRMNKFLGFERDEQYLERVLEETTLDSLRSHYNSDQKALQNVFCNDEAGNTIIFRKGDVGDWKTHFTVAQSETVDKLLEQSLKHGMIKFKFEI